MSSINYNAAASSALRVLQSSNSALDATQSRISTGLKIAQAKDNAAYWSIATTMKSDNKALGTVKDALGLGAGTVDTAYQGLDAARAQLDDMKTKLTSALNPNVDREAVQKDIDAYLSSLKSIATSSVFSGENWLSVNSAVPGYSNTKQVVSSYSRDANGTVAIETIAIDTSKIALMDANASGNGILTSQSKLSAAGVDLAIGGNAATGAAPALAGLTGATTETKGTDAATASKAKASLGYFNLGGLDTTDTLTFQVALNGNAAATATVSLSGITDAAGFKNALQTALNTATSANSTVVNIDATSGEITVTSAQTGANSSVTISALTTLDGAGTKTGVGGMTAAAAQAKGTDTVADYSLNSAALTDTVATAGTKDDVISFDVELNGTTKRISFTNVNPSLSSQDIQTADQLKTVIQNQIDAQFGANKIKVSSDVTAATGFKFTSVDKGSNQTIIASNLTVVDSSGVDQTSVTARKLGLNFAARATGTSTAAAYTAGNYLTGSLGIGERVSFDVTLNGTTKTVVAAAHTTEGTYITNVQNALDAAFGANVIKFTSVNSTTPMTFTTVAKGASQTIQITNVQNLAGDGKVSSTLGLTNGAASGTDTTTLAKASVLTGSAFTAPVTFDAQDSQSFKLTVNGKASTVVVDKAAIETALTGQAGYVAGSGTISTATDYAKVLQTALGKAGVTGVTVSANTTPGLDFNKVRFEANTAGKGSVSIDAASVQTSSGASTVSVNEISITSDAFKALTKDQQTQVINAYINVVSDKLKSVTAAASMMGSVSARIESQKTFVSTLMDTIDKGVSGLVDADMNEESTKLQALQVKQQLGVQALSIANQSAQSVLSLFRG